MEVDGENDLRRIRLSVPLTLVTASYTSPYWTGVAGTAPFNAAADHQVDVLAREQIHPLLYQDGQYTVGLAPGVDCIHEWYRFR